jgi:hypothetical protein
MSAEHVAAALANLPALDATFGTRRAYGQLPDATDLSQKCLVYAVSNDTPEGNAAGRGLSYARMRFSVSAPELTDVIAGHDMLRSVTDYVRGVVLGGHHVVLVRKVLQGPPDRDAELGIWVRSDDYRLAYYD